MQPTPILAVSLLGLLMVAGCSHTAAPKPGVLDQPTAAGLASAAAREADDFFGLKVQAYFNDLSAACRKKTPVETLATVLAQADADSKTDVAAGLRGLKAGRVSTRNVSGTAGQALVTVVTTGGAASSSRPSYQNYVYEAGKWRSTAC